MARRASEVAGGAPLGEKEQGRGSQQKRRAAGQKAAHGGTGSFLPERRPGGKCEQGDRRHPRGDVKVRGGPQEQTGSSGGSSSPARPGAKEQERRRVRHRSDQDQMPADAREDQVPSQAGEDERRLLEGAERGREESPSRERARRPRATGTGSPRWWARKGEGRRGRDADRG